MMQSTEFSCNICNAKREPDDLLGFEFDSSSVNQVFRVRPAHQVHRHLCKNCADGLRAMLLQEEASKHWTKTA